MRSTPQRGLGLRAQIVLALSAAFVASFTLLGIATVQLANRARTLDRLDGAEATARVLAASLDRLPAPDRHDPSELIDAAIDPGGVIGVEVTRPGLHPVARGLTGGDHSAVAPLASGGEVRVWIQPPGASTAASFTNLLLLYVSVTGGAILLLAYVALTHLIVRPVTSVTRASERLAAGRADVEVPVRGAAEVARLAVAFNQMASQLRDERRALEDRLRELEQTTIDLESAQDQLLRSERLASVGRLAAGVAHEIGNPLSAILGLVELLRDGVDDEDREEFLGRIHAETERIHAIIRDLLDFSRQGDDEDDADATADLAEVVEDAVGLVAPQKDLRDVSIERRVMEDLPRVRGSADRLTQVVLNLLLNAADAIEGEGTIAVELRGTGDGEVELCVTDSGPGIDPAVAEHLFEPFVTTKPTGQGTGLGLAVCHTIVERLGGSLLAENAPGGGARFVVRVPAAV